MYWQRLNLGLTGLIMALSASGAWALSNPEDFESYPTGAFAPTAAVEGWTMETIAGNPTFDIDAVDGFQGTATLRVQSQGTSPTNAIARTRWHVSEDINTLPIQTMHVEWQGILRRPSDSFGRVVFNSSSSFVEMRSDGVPAVLRYDADPGAGVTAGDFVLPTDAVSFSWPSNTVPTAWYAIDIESNYNTNQVRARFGTRDASTGLFNWNSFSPFLDMINTSQQSDITTNVDGRAHFDNLSFSAVPEPGTLALLGLAGLLMVARKRR